MLQLDRAGKIKVKTTIRGGDPLEDIASCGQNVFLLSSSGKIYEVADDMKLVERQLTGLESDPYHIKVMRNPFQDKSSANKEPEHLFFVVSCNEMENKSFVQCIINSGPSTSRTLKLASKLALPERPHGVTGVFTATGHHVVCLNAKDEADIVQVRRLKDIYSLELVESIKLSNGVLSGALPLDDESYLVFGERCLKKIILST